MMKKLLYEIVHNTTYDYVDEVSVSHHLLKLTPRHYGKQSCLFHEVTVIPDIAWQPLQRVPST